MECVKLYLGCLIMLACLYGTLNADCRTILEDMDACYTSRGFPVPSTQLTSGGLPPLARLTDQFGADVCLSRQSDLAETLKCMLQLSQNCESELAAVLPSPDQAEEIISYECAQQRIVDMDCISRNLNFEDDVLVTCITDKATKLYFASFGTSDMTQLLCGSLDAFFKFCQVPALKKCGCAAVNYIAKYVTGSFRPTVCGASTPDPGSRDGVTESMSPTDCGASTLDPGSIEVVTEATRPTVFVASTQDPSTRNGNGGAAIVAQPVMLFSSLFVIMIKFYIA